MNPLRLTFRKSDHVVLMPDWVSEGHWAIHRSLVLNPLAVASPEAVAESFGVSNVRTLAIHMSQQFLPTPTALLHQWTVTEWVRDDRMGAPTRILQASDGPHAGELAGIDERYRQQFHIAISDALYGSGPDKPFYDAPTLPDIRFAVMPMKLPSAVVVPMLPKETR